MLVKEACNILSKKMPYITVLKCIEYPTIYAFSTTINGAKDVLDSCYFVDKKSRQVGIFSPFIIPIEEFRKGREIKVFR